MPSPARNAARAAAPDGAVDISGGAPSYAGNKDGSKRLKKAVSEGRGIQSVEVGGKLLRTLADASAPMMLRDLAAAASLAPAQAHAYLVSFRRANLVEQDAASGMYRLGPFAMRLGLSRMRSVEPLAAASKVASRLSQQLGLMVAVVVWGPNSPTAVQVQEGAHTLNINVRAGTVFSVTGSASGRVFGAYAPSESLRRRADLELKGEIRDLGLGVRSSRAEYDAEIARVLRDGFATIADMPVPGISAIAAPVFDAAGALALAMTLIGPNEAIDIGPDSAAVKTLIEACSGLSHAPLSAAG